MNQLADQPGPTEIINKKGRQLMPENDRQDDHQGSDLSRVILFEKLLDAHAQQDPPDKGNA